LLEVACVVTDENLNLIDGGVSYVIWQPVEALQIANEFVTNMHTASGLFSECISSTLTEQDVEILVLNYLATHTKQGESPLCGNTIGFDRSFVNMHMPNLAKWFHYRSIDVSTVKELAKRWYPGIEPPKKLAHRALPDIYESLEELRLYRSQVFR
jgi:oligoribonuclease